MANVNLKKFWGLILTAAVGCITTVLVWGAFRGLEITRLVAQ
jgi:hypothetical protein